MMNIVASGQVKVIDKVYAYALLDGGAYRLTGHGVEMVTVQRANNQFGLKMTKGALRNVALRTMKIDGTGRLVTVS